MHDIVQLHMTAQQLTHFGGTRSHHPKDPHLFDCASGRSKHFPPRSFTIIVRLAKTTHVSHARLATQIFSPKRWKAAPQHGGIGPVCSKKMREVHVFSFNFMTISPNSDTTHMQELTCKIMSMLGHWSTQHAPFNMHYTLGTMMTSWMLDNHLKLKIHWRSCDAGFTCVEKIAMILLRKRTWSVYPATRHWLGIAQTAPLLLRKCGYKELWNGTRRWFCRTWAT